jgi:lysozyme
MTRPIPKQAIDLIKSFENCKLAVYLDQRGIPTQGWGHTNGITTASAPITQQQADEWLALDVAWAGEDVEREVEVPLNDNQFSALVDFVYECGSGNFAKSSLLTVLNRGFYDQVPAHLAMWNESGGVVSAGLVRRRAAEVALWNDRGA